ITKEIPKDNERLRAMLEHDDRGNSVSLARANRVSADSVSIRFGFGGRPDNAEHSPVALLKKMIAGISRRFAGAHFPFSPHRLNALTPPSTPCHLNPATSPSI